MQALVNIEKNMPQNVPQCETLFHKTRQYNYSIRNNLVNKKTV
jgi:hypothetical protein